MAKTVTLKELRPNLPKIIQEVDKRMERFVVTRRGYPVAVIMSPDDLEGILETLEILEDKALVVRIKKAEKELMTGKTRTLDKIHRALGLV